MGKIRKIFLCAAAAFTLAAAVLPVSAETAPAFAAEDRARVAVDGTTKSTYTDADGNSFAFSYFPLAGYWVLTDFSGVGGNVTLPLPDKCNTGTDLPDAVSYRINEGVFYGNTTLDSVIIPEGVTEIGSRAFGDTTIASVTISSTVEKISDEAFSGCWLLESVVFEEAEGEAAALVIDGESFKNCMSLTNLELPARLTSVFVNAFDGCRSLKWLYVNSDVLTTSFEIDGFGKSTTIVYSCKEYYEKAAKDVDAQLSYLVPVTFTVGGERKIATDKLYGRDFSYERNVDKNSKDYNGWYQNQAVTDLPAQDESYRSTVWYFDAAFETRADFEYVNGILKNQLTLPETIELYAHATVTPPNALKTVSQPYRKEGYALADAEKMASLVGLEEYAHKSSLVFTAISKDEQSTLEKLENSGTYLVSISLDKNLGVWKDLPMVTLNIGGNEGRTTRIMLVMLSLFGLLAVVLTIALVLVRSQVGRKKRRELTSEEAIDKFIASGGRTRLKK